MAVKNEVKIFSGTKSKYLAEEIAKAYGIPLGDCTISYFADGEFQPSFNESVRGCDVFLIQSTFANSDNLMELLLMIDAAKRASAHYITAVIPYFGMARQDRKDKPRVSIGSKVVADMLTVAGASRVITMDLHAPQIQGFFEVPVDHLDPAVIFLPYMRSLNMGSNIVIASPDMGSSARARTYAKALGCDMVIVDKERRRANEIASMTLIGDVTGKDVLMVDDIIDTGNTLAKAAQLLIDKGANSVRAMCTHPVLSGKAYDNIENSVLEELVVCNTIPLARQDSKIKVLSVAQLFADAIKNITEHGSISSLFDMSK
ncbi:MAG: ribose-phosphate pyrophosphokinase [Bacteroidia bacterium]|nr:ribose-phosphate pyrophosphokinase [Bacteroidia bacterium]MCF8425695.1 ribose-phosphate pyrophosphokinase [Bacteroidia bacterium]MCF8446011.1 ribose-phosphate pyrophosphokinase [Bacteroidia bacterium]